MIEKGKRYVVKSAELQKKYGTDRVIITIEGPDREVLGKSWMDATGNAAAMWYAIRSSRDRLPLTSKGVYYGKVQHLGELVHESELTPVDVAVPTP